ncbi:hypothetical protein BD311DRAFT_800961 [Dichomitus squalens]|uniref:Uncharacterized protein n=1 Tax=Dichomitus squalens TaxID=114155 RepID=A0A4Q9M3H8_9APHY|nr:hypothetical protein BD311DRAFT_800961 [Dichomitus squalens]
MDVDAEPPSSQFPLPDPNPSPSSARVHWASNPEKRLLTRQLVFPPLDPLPDAVTRPSAHQLPPSRNPRPLPPDHPARAKRFDIRSEESPSIPQHMDDLQSAIDRMKGKLQQNAKQKANNERRQGSLSILDDMSTPLLRHPPRREHTAEGILPSKSASNRPSRLQTRASQSDVPRASRQERATTPVGDLSRAESLGILESLRKPMDIDWEADIPSSTPSPPCRPHKKRSSTADASSPSDPKRESQTSSSSSAAVSPLSIHHGLHSRSDSLDEDSSMAMGDATADTSLVDDDMLPEPHPPSPEVPSPSAAAMPPPRPPPVPAPQRPKAPPEPLSRSTQPPAPTPHPPSLSRPFAPPSQVRPGQSQAARPRPSQHPPPLGMRRLPGQPATSANVKKPYKLSIGPNVKKPPAAAQPQPADGARISARAHARGAQCLSPAVPDPPRLAVRASATVQGPRPAPVLEMSARRPMPVPEPDEEPKDANSSADLWAWFDD